MTLTMLTLPPDFGLCMAQTQDTDRFIQAAFKGKGNMTEMFSLLKVPIGPALYICAFIYVQLLD